MAYCNLSYLRKAKADAIEKVYKEGIPQKDNLNVEIYENATVLPCTLTENGDKWRQCMAGVVKQNGTIVPISCTWPYAEISDSIGGG